MTQAWIDLSEQEPALYEVAEAKADVFFDAVAAGANVHLPLAGGIGRNTYALSAMLGESSSKCQALLLAACSAAVKQVHPNEVRERDAKAGRLLAAFVEAVAQEYGDEYAALNSSDF